MEEQPLVSVVVSCYNHSRYIEECLRSIAMQRVNFPYEVYVGDDHSPDGSAEVLKRLESELPENFTFILREKNLGALGNGEDLYARAKGKYLVHIEGDDYWTYDGRLQAQVDFMEAHPEYSAVYTRCTVVGEDSRPNGEEYPQCPNEDYSFREFFYSRMPGQSGTLLCRRELYLTSRDEFMHMGNYGYYPGDRRNAFLFLVHGKVRCMQEDWAAYRHVVKKGATNYSSTVKFNDAYAHTEVAYGKTLVRYAERHGSPEAILTAKKTYYRFYLKWASDKRSTLKLADSMHELLAEPRYKLRFLLGPLQWYAVLGFRKLRGVPVDL